MGGHFVQGHVDGTSASPSWRWRKKGDDYRLESHFCHKNLRQLVVFKGSIAINGISLTVASVQPDSLTVWIIPHTHEHTNLQAAQAGDLVNLEFDVLAKYVERILGRAPAPQPPTHFTDRDLS